MPDALSFAEIDGQHVELLPTRLVLGTFGRTSTGICAASDPCSTSAPDGKSIDGVGEGAGEGTGGAGGHLTQHVVVDQPGAVSHSTQDASGGDGIGGSARFSH